MEHYFNNLKPFRRVATCYNKLATSFIAIVHLASIWLLGKSYNVFCLFRYAVDEFKKFVTNGILRYIIK